MKHEYNDGGREAAGFKGKTRDCVTRAIAIAAKLPYAQVYADLAKTLKACNKGGKKFTPRYGVSKAVTKKYMAKLGWTWTPTMHIGSGCKVHLNSNELPAGRLIVSTSHHLAAVIDGVLHDNHDSSRDGKRCVYGYWQKV